MGEDLDFFGLERSPFEDRPGGIVLATRPLKRALERVTVDVAGGAPLICVAGVEGIGRTSVARVLARRLSEPDPVSGEILARTALLRDPHLSWGKLSGEIARQLELFALTPEALCEARALGVRLVVLIDGAEHISAETLDRLEMVLRAGSEGVSGEPAVQIVLLADPGVAAAQAEMPLLSWFEWRSVAQIELEPIGSRDLHRYIAQLMRSAGWEGAPLFTEAASLAVHRISRGVPRAVSEVCRLALALAAERTTHEIDAAIVEDAWDAKSRALEAPLGETEGGAADAACPGSPHAVAPRPLSRPGSEPSRRTDEAGPGVTAQVDASCERPEVASARPGLPALEAARAVEERSPSLLGRSLRAVAWMGAGAAVGAAATLTVVGLG